MSKYIYFEYKRTCGEWGAASICIGINSGDAQARLAMDRRVYLAQKELLSREMAE